MSALPIRQRVLGKPREQIAVICEGVRRDELLDLVHELATLEAHVTEKEIAQRRRIGAKKAHNLLASGEISPAFKVSRTAPLQAPISAVHSYFEKLQVNPRRNGSSI